MRGPRVTQVAVFYAPRARREVKVGRLAVLRGRVLFEYDAAFLASGLELSPLKLPLRPGVFSGEPNVLSGLMGVFDDSLPDGWGRLLMDRRAAQLGLSASAFTPLDRLAIVGARGMGALRYEPEAPLEEPARVKLAALAAETRRVLSGASGADLEQLIALGGSPQGARPKVLVQRAPGGELVAGARDVLPDHTAWLVKFPSRLDARDSAQIERAYFLMAEAAGLAVPRTELLGATSRHPGFFAIERFDRAAGRRTHTHTLGGLLHLPHGYAALDYLDLLHVTRRVTRDESAVRENFRRACFNVLAHNRDDHARNFAFVMDERGEWQPSPAYDLTFSEGPGGEHTTLVLGEGRQPGATQLRELAAKAGLRRAEGIIKEVRAAVRRFERFAADVGVSRVSRTRIARVLRETSAR